MVNYTKQAVKGVSSVLLLSLAAAFVGYLVRFLLARYLSVEDYGLFYAVFSFLGMVGLFKSLGMDQSLIKFIPEFLTKKRYSYIKGSILLTASILFITNTIIITLIYLSSRFLAQNYFHITKASIVLNLMAIAFFVDSFVLSLRYVYQSFKRMALFSGIELTRMLIIFLIILSGIKYSLGILLPITAYILTPMILLLFFSIFFIKKVFPKFNSIKPKSKLSLFKKLSRYGFFVIATNIGMMILGYTDTLTLTYFSGVAAVGFYNVAFPTANALSYFPKALVSNLFPMTAELWTKKKKKIIILGIESVYKYSIILILPAVLILVTFPELIISTFFGDKYLPAVPALQILSLGMILPCIYGSNSAFFSGIGKPQINSIIVYSTATFNLISNIILIPLLGIVGASITTTLSVVLMAIIGSIKIKRFINIKFPILSWVKTLLSGIIFALTVFFLKNILYLNVWVKASLILVISLSIYVLILFITKNINLAEIKNLIKIVLRK